MIDFKVGDEVVCIHRPLIQRVPSLANLQVITSIYSDRDSTFLRFNNESFGYKSFKFAKTMVVRGLLEELEDFL